MDIYTKIQRDMAQLSAFSSLDLRRWLVEKVVMSEEAQAILRTMDPPAELLSAAEGAAPTPEHAGIAARLIYTQMQRPDLLLQLPSVADPKSWNVSSMMTWLILQVFEPWNEFRYDPRSETIQTALPNGQWTFHLRGKDSDNYLTLKVQGYINALSRIGFDTIAQSLIERGLLSLNPSDFNMTPSDFALALQSSMSFFEKFCLRVSAVKECVDQIQRMPIMFFDTSTMNCIQHLVAVGNGVVPTQDIIDYTETGDRMMHPAGKLIRADREFVLSSATGLAWPNDDNFEWFIDRRRDIHESVVDETWDDWIDGARIYSEALLTTHCPTYKTFLDHAFPPDPTPEERDAFLRLLGAAVFGTNLKIVAAMIGAPNAGKDTVIKWLNMILGDGQVGVLSSAAFSNNMDDQRAFAPLKGARVAVLSGEVGEGRGSGILADKLKSVTSGGGTLTVAEKYEKPSTIFFDGMLIMQGNSVPQIIGGDKALYRNRLVAVEFKHPFPLLANSFEREYRKEAPRFLQILFLAYLDYVERGGGMTGIAPPVSWRAFSEEVELNADPLSIIDACLTGPNKAIEIPAPTFYKALSILAERTLGLRYPISSQKWAARLKRAGIDLRKDKATRHKSRVARADYQGTLFHFTLDADKSDGFFTQQDWTNALQSASMTSV